MAAAPSPVSATVAGPAPAAAAPSGPEAEQPELLWIGSTEGVEKGLVEQAGLPYKGIETGQLRGAGPWKSLVHAGRMVAGLLQARRLVASYRPEVCLATGGYVCAPLVAACRLTGIPVLIYLPDMVPGLAIRWLSYLAQRVAVSFEDVSRYFGAKAVVTGYPVRQQLIEAAQNRPAARRRLAQLLQRELESRDEAALLLVWGGSQGARSINLAVTAGLSELLPRAHVLHVTGNLDYERVRSATAGLPAAWAKRYHLVAYLHESMPWALAAADLSVCRAGASVLGELPVARLPSILVPYPHAGSHQQANALALADSGAGLILADEALGAQLTPTLVTLLADDERRAAMETALARLARPEAARAIAQLLTQLARSQRR